MYSPLTVFNNFLDYMNQKHEIISIVPFMLGRPAYHTGSLNVTKQVLEADQLTTEKPHELTAALMLVLFSSSFRSSSTDWHLAGSGERI